MLGLLLSGLLLSQPLSGAALVEALSSGGSSNYKKIVRYELEVRLDPAAKELSGKGVIRWTNPSSKPVREIWWHLYLNAFRNDRSSFMLESGGKLRGDSFEAGQWGFIEVQSLTATPPKTPNEVPADLLAARSYEHPDDDNADDRSVMRTPLPFAVEPGETVSFAVEWRARLPKVFARSGWSGSFFMVGQWFPKLGVLEQAAKDAAPSWNCHQYHATSEFYADYGEYQVAITTPKDQVVGATGVLTESKASEADGSVTRVYVLDHVHDFAFAADSNFVELEREIDPNSLLSSADLSEASRALGLDAGLLRLSPVKVRLLLQAQHAEAGERYLRAIGVALAYAGLWYGAYPYPTLTLIDGPRGASGAMGMEYPTLIAGGYRWPSPSDGPSPEQVTVHEMLHQYWYGLVGSNEFEQAFLDEGLTTYSTGLITDRVFPDMVFLPWWSRLWLDGPKFSSSEIARVGTMWAGDRDQIDRPSWAFRNDTSYGVNVYTRTTLVLRQLEHELGPDVLLRGLRLYQLRFRYRHPRRADFERALEEVSGRPLEGFFSKVFGSPGQVDYGISELKSVEAKPGKGWFEDPASAPGTLPEERQAASTSSASAGATWQTRVYLERYGAQIFPVTLELELASGEKQRAQWDGQYAWQKITVQTDQRVVWARLHPDGELPLDVMRSNDTRRVEPSRRPGVTFGAHALYLAQTLWQLLGALL